MERCAARTSTRRAWCFARDAVPMRQAARCSVLGEMRLFPALIVVALSNLACPAPRAGEACRVADPSYCLDRDTSVSCKGFQGNVGPGQYVESGCRNCSASLGGSVSCAAPNEADAGLRAQSCDAITSRFSDGRCQIKFSCTRDDQRELFCNPLGDGGVACRCSPSAQFPVTFETPGFCDQRTPEGDQARSQEAFDRCQFGR